MPIQVQHVTSAEIAQFAVNTMCFERNRILYEVFLANFVLFDILLRFVTVRKRHVMILNDEHGKEMA